MIETKSSTPRHPIRVVVERTGLKAELIRAWERRHGAIAPRRTAGRHRLYSDDDVARLNLLRQATEAGRPIGQVAGLDDGELRALVAGTSAAPREESVAEVPKMGSSRIDRFLAAARRLDDGELAFLLEQSLTELGPRRALAEVVTPLARAAQAPSSAVVAWWPRSRRELFLSRQARDRYRIDRSFLSPEGTLEVAELPKVRTLAAWLNARRSKGASGERLVGAAELHAAGMVQAFWQRLVSSYLSERDAGALAGALDWLREGFGWHAVERTLSYFAEHFGTPPEPTRGSRSAVVPLSAAPPELQLERLWLLWLANHNPAFEPLRDLFDDRPLEAATGYSRQIESLATFFREEPGYGPERESLFDLLRQPALAAPDSLRRQLEAIIGLEEGFGRHQLDRLRRGLDVLSEEEAPPFGGPPAPPPVTVTFAPPARPVPRPPEEPWMATLVLVAKNVNVWLDQLSRAYERPIRRLDEVPDAELERLAGWGMSGLWLVGLWRRSPASRRLKERTGHPDADASAYALYDYEVAPELGGEKALAELERRAAALGLRLAGDFVPNHMGLDSPWVVDHPDWFVQLEAPPFPSYTFTGEDLSSDPRVVLQLEDHYADQTDAAVVFRRLDRQTGEERFLYHGNDGTSLPWNDTAQLDYSLPEVREAMIRTLLAIARRFPVIRIDAAMTLVKQHFERLWYPRPGEGGAIPSRAEHSLPAGELDRRMPEEFWREAVERVVAEAPGTLLLAEGFWLLESYFIRELGMHRVYNAAFMHLLRDEDNVRFRGLMKGVLEADPRMLERFVNFLTNPDEAPAAEQLGKGDKYFALATLLATMPGLPLFGHGQVEGLAEKYGMEYRRAHYTEAADPHFVARHEREIAPLLKDRQRFASAEGFHLLDAVADGGAVVEDVLAFSNRSRDRAVVVVVHNRRASVRVRLPDLGEALELDRTCRFHEARSGVTLELEERGLELALGPYEHLVLDVVDDAS